MGVCAGRLHLRRHPVIGPLKRPRMWFNEQNGQAVLSVIVMESRLDQISEMNVSQPERIASLVAGGIVIYAVARKSWFRILLGVGAGYLIYRGMTGKDPLLSKLGMRAADHDARGLQVEQAVTVNKPVEEVYQFWHNFENLPRFMEHLKEVQVLDSYRSHWVAKGPMDSNIEWDAEITNDRPGEMIAWRSLPGSRVTNEGSVTFHPAPSGRGTEVHVLMEYSPPVGSAGAVFAKLFGEEPNTQVREDLRHFKQVMETGEMPSKESVMQSAL